MTPTNKPVRRRHGRNGLPPPALHNSMQVELVPTASLNINPQNPRRRSRADEKAARQIISAQKFIPPLVADRATGIVRIGEIILLAARELGIANLPVIWIEGLTEAELQAMTVAYERLGETGDWDRGLLAELNIRFEVEIPDYRPEHIGFEVGEMDVIIGEIGAVDAEETEEVPEPEAVAISKVGDIWELGKHRIVCGDATDSSTFAVLMSGSAPVSFVFSDPPFGCSINGFVTGEGRHREFVMGSGDMAPDELATFFGAFIKAMLSHVKSGAVVELVIDWRSLHLLLDAAVPLLGPLINLAVWAKDRPGQGSFLRSQHELVLIFRNGKGRFRNNVQLGRHGRSRSNVWSYPSAKTASKGSDEGNMLQHHPTPKPVRLVADAILDCTRRGDVVLDAFLGSGTTLLAAEKVGRACRGVELDPLYVDLAVRRWQAWTAMHRESGRTFDAIAADIASIN